MLKDRTPKSAPMNECFELRTDCQHAGTGKMGEACADCVAYSQTLALLGSVADDERQPMSPRLSASLLAIPGESVTHQDEAAASDETDAPDIDAIY